MRHLAGLAGALLMLAAACGDTDGTDTGPADTGTAAPPTTAAPATTTPPEPVELRVGVALTPQELETFQPALEAIDDAHPEWELVLETTPQGGAAEKITTQLAAGNLPDVVRVSGLSAQQWVRQNAFLDLGPLASASGLDLSEWYDGPVDQFRWQDTIWGIPDVAAPDVLYYNKGMFDAAGLDYPDDTWTFEDVREAANLLTLDSQGRNATDPDFDEADIVQWGWNGGITFFWQRYLVQPFGGDFCVNDDCTEMSFTDPATVEAVEWWADFTHEDDATLYDPYGGSQTGVPGDPFVAGVAAMGYNGFFAVGQLNAAGTIDYDVAQPPLGEDGNRYTPLSTSGWVIAANSEHPQEAWELIMELVDAEELAESWGRPGHGVPARRAAAPSVLESDDPPENREVILQAMEYGTVFKPYTASAFQVYGATADMFVAIMRGDTPAAAGLATIEQSANEILAGDRDG